MFKAPFSFNGRIRRMEYFLSFLVGGLIFGIAFFLGVGTALFGAASNSGSGFGVGVLIGFIALIADIWFSLAQYVKRLHDTDKSGWLILLSLIPVVNFALALYMLFADGTVGPNRYGLDPKKPDALQRIHQCKCQCKRCKSVCYHHYYHFYTGG